MKRAFVEHQYTAQDVYYQSEFPGSTHQVILLNGEPAGRIYLHRTPEEIAILDMVILPAFRRRGIASTLIKRLQEEAKQDRTIDPCLYRDIQSGGHPVYAVWVFKKAPRMGSRVAMTGFRPKESSLLISTNLFTVAETPIGCIISHVSDFPRNSPVFTVIELSTHRVMTTAAPTTA